MASLDDAPTTAMRSLSSFSVRSTWAISGAAATSAPRPATCTMFTGASSSTVSPSVTWLAFTLGTEVPPVSTSLKAGMFALAAAGSVAGVVATTSFDVARAVRIWPTLLPSNTSRWFR